MAIKDININNYYVCEIHFPNQILDYATRKILIKTAKPLSLVELNALPPHERFVKAAIPMRIPRRRQTINYSYDHEYDDDNDDGHSENTFDPEVIIAKTEENYHNGDLLEPLAGHDDDSKYFSTMILSVIGSYWKAKTHSKCYKTYIRRLCR